MCSEIQIWAEAKYKRAIKLIALEETHRQPFIRFATEVRVSFLLQIRSRYVHQAFNQVEFRLPHRFPQIAISVLNSTISYMAQTKCKAPFGSPGNDSEWLKKNKQQYLKKT